MIGAARALYSKQPTEAEASAWGLTVDEASGPPVEVWPDNWPTVMVFQAMGTQWRVGPGGPYGLDYGVIENVMRLVGVSRKQIRDVFDGLRVMEEAALTQMRA